MIVRIMIAAALVSSICGCANSLLYDENRDIQAKATVKAVEEAHLTGTVESLDKAFADMAAREEKSARERAEQLFDWEMVRVSRARSLNSEFKDDNKDVDGLATSAKERLAELGLPSQVTAAPKDVPALEATLKSDTAALAKRIETFQNDFRVEFKDCKSISDKSADRYDFSDRPSLEFIESLPDNKELRDRATAQFKGLMTTCAEIDKSLFGLGRKSKLGVDLERLRAREVLLRKDTEALAVARYNFLGSFGVKFETCNEIYSVSADPAKKSETPSAKFLEKWKAEEEADHLTGVKNQYPDLVRQCRRNEDSIAKRDALFGPGLITKLFANLEKREKERAAYKAAVEKATKELTAVKKAAEPITKEATPSKPALAELEAGAKKVLEIVGKAGQINELAGKEVLSQNTLDRLEALLGGLAGTEADGKVVLPKDQWVTVQLVRNVASLHDEAEQLFADAAKPRLIPFLAAIEYQKLVLERIQAENKTKDKEAEALRRQLQAHMNEAVALARVVQPIEVHGWGSKSITELDHELNGSDKRTLYSLLGTYGDEVREKRVDAEVWKSRALAAGYERDIVSSKYAARQWDTMMDMTAKVLADYHASGIKPDDLTEFFKALGLVVIGVGVAQ